MQSFLSVARLTVPVLAALSVASAPAAPPAPAQPASGQRTVCGALLKKGTLGKKAVTNLPIGGARIDAVAPARTGETSHCKVTGQIAGDRGAVPLRFRLDLPSDWNLNAVHFADGIDGASLAVDPARALAAGYALLGPAPNAAGVRAGNPASGSSNAAVAAQKKLRDVAAELLARRFGRFSDRFYFVAAQPDAQQALTLAARYPRAYRGMLVDASGAGAAAAMASPPGNAEPPLVDYSSALAPYVANGGKLLILAPAIEPVSGPLPIVEFQRDQVAKKGRRYAEDFARLFELPEAAAAGTVDWLPVLVDWAQNLKAPAASVVELPRRP